MHLKTPKFWFKNNHEISPLLYTLKPLSKLWELVLRFRLKNGLWEKMPIPVICVGNLTIGGSGKTPVTMSLQKLLEDMGIKACICLLYTSPSPRDKRQSRMPSSA